MKRTAGSYVHALSFRSLNRFYDLVVRLVRERAFKQALLARARIEPGHRVLDLACGTGTLSIMAAGACPGADVFGLDGDLVILQQARRKGPERPWICADATALPFPDKCFDRVLSTLFFHHLTREAKVESFREVRRVLRAGGELHFADFSTPAKPLMRLCFLFVQLLDGFTSTADHASGLLPILLTQAGFSTVTETAHFNTVAGTIRLYVATC